MASKYRKVSTRIWNDAAFIDLSDDGKLAFLFLLTHPQMTPLGAMRATVQGLAAELEWDPERLSEAFREAFRKGMLKVDEKRRCVFLPNFIKHNRPESPNVVKAWASCIDDIPDGNLKLEAIQAARSLAETLPEAFGKAFESLPEVFAKGMPNQEQEQEQEQEEDESPNGDLSPPKAATSGRAGKRMPACPQKEIIALYLETLPELPAVNSWPEAAARQLKTRWRESERRQSLDWWREFFGYVKQSDFLMGRKTDFAASLQWLVKPTNFAKVVNGNYANKTGRVQ